MRDGVYREAPVPVELAEHVACVWYRRIGEFEAARPVRIVPDGCMDLIWRPGELLVAGPDTTAQIMPAMAGAEMAGLRFCPGAAPAILGVPASELVNQRPDALAVWGTTARELLDRLDGAASPTSAAGVLQAAVLRRLREAPPLDPVVRRAVAAARRAGDDRAFRVDELAGRAGLSERQLLRRCRVALGYGPKTLARIVRFQRFLARVRGASTRQAGSDPAEAGPGSGKLADVAIEVGYADQAHLTREVHALAGVPPAALLAEYAR